MLKEEISCLCSALACKSWLLLIKVLSEHSEWSDSWTSFYKSIRWNKNREEKEPPEIFLSTGNVSLTMNFKVGREHASAWHGNK